MRLALLLALVLPAVASADTFFALGRHPNWSASGNQLAYSNVPMGTFVGRAQVASYPSRAVDLNITLSSGSFLPIYMEWSWDNQFLFYGISGIYRADMSGNETTIFPQASLSVAWYPVAPSPDGSTLAVVTTVAGDHHIWLMNSDGTNLRQLTTGPGTEFDCHWSPDGTEIVYSGFMPGALSREIFKVSVNGGPPTQLTDNLEEDQSPRFSPDGTEIVFTSDRGGTYDIWVMSANGGNQTRLTDGPFIEQTPDLSPSGVLAYETNASLEAWEIFTKDVSQVTRDTSAPPSPGGPMADWNGAEVELAWPGVSGAVGYRVYRAQGMDPLAPVSGRLVYGEQFVDDTAQPGLTYRYAVTATNVANNESAPSPEATVTTGNATATPTPMPTPSVSIQLAGHGLTSLASDASSLLTFYAFAPGASEIAVTYEGLDIGWRLRDDGLGSDDAAGDGLFTYGETLDLTGASPVSFLLGLQPAGDALPWPSLTVQP